MKTDVQHATREQTSHGGSAGCAVAAILLMMMTAGVVTAKSMYVVARIINFDAPIPVHVYDIGADGRLTYQTEFGAPFLGAGMVGIAMDSDSGYLFSTYEDTGWVLVTNATTLQRRAVLSIQNASNLAGVVYDHQKRLLYCAEFGGPRLFVLNWDPLTGKLIPVPGSPFTLAGAELYGIALDEYSDLLYVASPSQGIGVYSTWDWSLVGTMLAGRIAISIAVDPQRDFLYYGGGYAENFYLTQRKLSDGSKREVLVDPNGGVMGLGVDVDTGLIYITTGRENRPGGKDLMVFDPNLELLQTIDDIGRPTGLAIPIHDTSFNPLHLTKTVKNGLGGKPDDEGLYYVIIGDQLTYSICFDDGGYDVTEVTVVDKLPPEVDFIDATGNDRFGHYDAATHTYRWENPPLTPGDRTCLELVCRVRRDTTPGQVIANRVTIDSDKTPPSTVGVGAVATEATYNPLNLRKTVASPEPPADGSTVYAFPGEEATYRISFDNKDNERPVANVVLVDSLPQQVEFVSATCDGVHGSYDRATHTYTWVWPSLAARDGNSLDLVVRLSDKLQPGTVITNRATIKSDQTPQVSKEANLTVAFAPLEVEKTVVSPAVETDDRGRPCAGAGEKVTYRIRFRNPAKDVAVTQITIVDELPAEMTFVSAEGDRDFGSYDAVAHAFTWQYPLLPAGGEADLEIVTQVKEAVEPNTVVSNTVTISSRQAAPSQARADVVVCEGAIPAQMYVRPAQIWRNNSKATPDLMVIVHLPEGYGMERIVDTPLVLTPGNVPSASMRIYGSGAQGKVLCVFDTGPILAATQGYGEFPIRVTGRLYGGRSFVADGTIAILKFGGP